MEVTNNEDQAPTRQRIYQYPDIGLDSLQNPEHFIAFALNDPALGISL